MIINIRPSDWSSKMNKLESCTDKYLKNDAVKLITNETIHLGDVNDIYLLSLLLLENNEIRGVSSLLNQGRDVSRTFSSNGKWVSLDESGQPLDTSGIKYELLLFHPYLHLSLIIIINQIGTNSWSRRISEISWSELLETVNVNAVAPFILIGNLKKKISPLDNEINNKTKVGFIINVTALEGKFNVGKKSSGIINEL